MFISLRNAVLLLGAMLGTPLVAQDSSALPHGRIELAIGFNGTRPAASSNENFWMQGGTLQLHGQFWHGLGLVADISGMHTGNMHGSGLGLDLVTVTFGARYTHAVSAKQRFQHLPLSIFVQELTGEAFGLNSQFPATGGVTSSSYGAAFLSGGGINLKLSHHFVARAMEADWIRTQLPNASGNAQNDLRLLSGVVYTF
jgi:hypothetical protein